MRVPPKNPPSEYSYTKPSLEQTSSSCLEWPLKPNTGNIQPKMFVFVLSKIKTNLQTAFKFHLQLCFLRIYQMILRMLSPIILLPMRINIQTN